MRYVDVLTYVYTCLHSNALLFFTVFCSSLPMTWLMDERRLVFYRKAMVHSSIVIRTLMSVSRMYFDYIGLCHKYQIPNPYCSVSYIKHALLYGVILLNMLCYKLRCVCFYFSSFMIVLFVLFFLQLAFIIT